MTADQVLLPVEIDILPQMVQARKLAREGRLMLDVTGPASEPLPSEADAWYVDGQGQFDRAMLQRLHANLRHGGVLALFSQCAALPDEWVTKAEIDEILGKGPFQLRNELGALSKLTKKLFGRIVWPVQWAKVDGAYQYRMPAGVAAEWLRLSNS